MKPEVPSPDGPESRRSFRSAPYIAIQFDMSEHTRPVRRWALRGGDSNFGYSPLPHIPKIPYWRCGGTGKGGSCGVSGTSITPRPAAITDIPGAT